MHLSIVAAPMTARTHLLLWLLVAVTVIVAVVWSAEARDRRAVEDPRVTVQTVCCAVPYEEEP